MNMFSFKAVKYTRLTRLFALQFTCCDGSAASREAPAAQSETEEIMEAKNQVVKRLEVIKVGKVSVKRCL